MTLLKRFLNELMLLFEKMKGSTTVHEVKLPKHALGHLEGFDISGFQIRIYCQKRLFWRQYHCKLIPDKYMTTYRIFSVVSSDAPMILREACELDIDIPSQLTPFIDDDGQKDAAISAYLDLLQLRLKSADTKPAA
jgi:hypothetical protein